MNTFISNFSFWFALLLSIGSLIFYLSVALLNREIRAESTDKWYDFNLGLPKVKDYENLLR